MVIFKGEEVEYSMVSWSQVSRAYISPTEHKTEGRKAQIQTTKHNFSKG